MDKQLTKIHIIQFIMHSFVSCKQTPGGRTMIFRNYQQIAELALIINRHCVNKAAGDIGVHCKTLHNILAGNNPTAKTVHKLIRYSAYLCCQDKF